MRQPREGIGRPNQRVPVVRHQHVPKQHEVQFATRFAERARQERMFPIGERSQNTAKIHGDEENAVRGSQPVNV